MQSFKGKVSDLKGGSGGPWAEARKEGGINLLAYLQKTEILTSQALFLMCFYELAWQDLAHTATCHIITGIFFSIISLKQFFSLALK